MKVTVKIKKIGPPYTRTVTESLQGVLYNHAHDKLSFHIGTKQLFDIMAELARRRKMSGIAGKSADEAFAEFNKHYRPKNPLSFEELHLQSLLTPHTLTPSYHGKECLGNGEWPGYKCQCDECDNYLTFFPMEESL